MRGLGGRPQGMRSILLPALVLPRCRARVAACLDGELCLSPQISTTSDSAAFRGSSHALLHGGPGAALRRWMAWSAAPWDT